MIKYLFIDAAYFNFRLKEWSVKYFNNHSIEVDYLNLAKGYDKIFYYDALASDDNEHAEYLNQLRELPDFHVFTGKVKGEGKKKRQKQVDILLAVHALTHTMRKNMNSVTLLAGDEDFTPLVAALVQEGMNVTIWAASESLSSDLKYSADRRKTLSAREVWHHYSKADFKKNFPPPICQDLKAMEKHKLQYENLGKSISTGSNHTLHLREDTEKGTTVILDLDSKGITISGTKKSVLIELHMRGEDLNNLKLQGCYQVGQ